MKNKNLSWRTNRKELNQMKVYLLLYFNLNMPLPPNFSCGSPMQDGSNEIGDPYNINNSDNFDVYVDDYI
jgi:hypothetical protein